jgi:hypothetical protein
MDIEAWLQGLGLEPYVPAFRDNDIDWQVLPKLTSEDLIEDWRCSGRPPPWKPSPPSMSRRSPLL